MVNKIEIATRFTELTFCIFRTHTTVAMACLFFSPISIISCIVDIVKFIFAASVFMLVLYDIMSSIRTINFKKYLSTELYMKQSSDVCGIKRSSLWWLPIAQHFNGLLKKPFSNSVTHATCTLNLHHNKNAKKSFSEYSSEYGQNLLNDVLYKCKAELRKCRWEIKGCKSGRRQSAKVANCGRLSAIVGDKNPIIFYS
uniref:Uncharacterized protein n=1 Tax=Romanomermis culicivorax TaxID=13658 RepID=A0A915JTG6_ROMCU